MPHRAATRLLGRGLLPREQDAASSVAARPRNAVNLSLQAVPSEIEPPHLLGYLQALPGVSSVHDLHVWAMSTTEMPRGAPGDEFINQVCNELHQRFRIAHPTVQIETGEHACRLEPAYVV